MSISKRAMNELSHAVDDWFIAYADDFQKSDPATLVMDGTQDGRVIACAASILSGAGDYGTPLPGVSNEIRWAAMHTVASYLEFYPESMEREDLWENHPLLVEADAEQAGELSERIAKNTASALLQGFAVMDLEKDAGNDSSTQ